MRCVGFVRGQPVDLFCAVHGVPQAQARTQFQVAWFEAAFQQQDGAAPVQRAQAFGLGQVQQGKAVGTPQACKGTGDAVAVGVGLDHGPDPGVGRAGARAAQGVGQGVGVDQGLDRAGHKLSGGVGGGAACKSAILTVRPLRPQARHGCVL